MATIKLMRLINIETTSFLKDDLYQEIFSPHLSFKIFTSCCNIALF